MITTTHIKFLSTALWTRFIMFYRIKSFYEDILMFIPTVLNNKITKN